MCQECGYEAPKWMGQCPACKTWNRMQEQLLVPQGKKSLRSAGAFSTAQTKPIRISEIEPSEEQRIAMASSELNRVLGGGLVQGSLTLIGGDPGIGKSTLLLQNVLCMRKRQVLYVSGEESMEQLKMRADRLGRPADNVFILCETSLENILTHAKEMKPDMMIVDSIQTISTAEMESTAGSVGQVRECTAKLLRFAKATGIAVIIIGHVTKDGNIAGPRLLEHMVDVVLQFEGDRSYSFRVLRALKNRFGSTSESGIFSMETGGLKEVANPAGLFLENRAENAPGSVVCACMEGNRPIMVEVQALVAKTPYGMPRRTAVGFDYNRVNMMLAILERRLGMDFGNFDAYLNVVGGMKITEPSADLAAAAALVSSYRNKPVPHGVLAVGEVGLTGEIRRVSGTERRIRDAANLGFTKFVVPKGKLNMEQKTSGIVQAATLEEALNAIFN